MTNILEKINTSLGDLADDIKYDVLKFPQPPFSEIRIPERLDLTLHKEENGVWVEADELTDFYAVADEVGGLPLAIHQAILLYCGVPRYFARRQPNAGYITFPDGTTVNLAGSLDKKLLYA